MNSLSFEPDCFNWDRGNARKNLKHRVTQEQVESIFSQNGYLFAGRIVEPVHDEWRGLVLGQDFRGRHLALIFTQRGHKLRPISCRAMRDKEVRLYHEKTEERIG